jgi:hypothetical protein
MTATKDLEQWPKGKPLWVKTNEWSEATYERYEQGPTGRLLVFYRLEDFPCREARPALLENVELRDPSKVGRDKPR